MWCVHKHSAENQCWQDARIASDGVSDVGSPQCNALLPSAAALAAWALFTACRCLQASAAARQATMAAAAAEQAAGAVVMGMVPAAASAISNATLLSAQATSAAALSRGASRAAADATGAATAALIAAQAAAVAAASTGELTTNRAFALMSVGTYFSCQSQHRL